MASDRTTVDQWIDLFFQTSLTSSVELGQSQSNGDSSTIELPQLNAYFSFAGLNAVAM
jgi:hypothetical protein